MKIENKQKQATPRREVNLGYFTEWGGHAWKNLCHHALLAIGDLHGKTVLEIGPRFGKMSTCFALLGAKVVAVETDAAALEQAEKEIRRWGVEPNVSFFHYDGELDHCHALNQLEFDVVFAKSVLVLLGDSLLGYLQKLNRNLKDDGKCVFIENRHGGPFFSLLRRVWPRSFKHYRRVTYLKPLHLAMINQVFHITEVKKTLLPPIYLIIAEKKN